MKLNYAYVVTCVVLASLAITGCQKKGAPRQAVQETLEPKDGIQQPKGEALPPKVETPIPAVVVPTEPVAEIVTETVIVELGWPSITDPAQFEWQERQIHITDPEKTPAPFLIPSVLPETLLIRFAAPAELPTSASAWKARIALRRNHNPTEPMTAGAEQEHLFEAASVIQLKAKGLAEPDDGGGSFHNENIRIELEGRSDGKTKRVTLQLPLRRPPRSLEIKQLTLGDFEKERGQTLTSNLRTLCWDQSCYRLIQIVEARNPAQDPISISAPIALKGSLVEEGWNHLVITPPDAHKTLNCSAEQKKIPWNQSWPGELKIIPMGNTAATLKASDWNFILSAGKAAYFGIYAADSAELRSSMEYGYVKKVPRTREAIAACQASCQTLNSKSPNLVLIDGSLKHPGYGDVVASQCWQHCQKVPSAECNQCYRLEQRILDLITSKTFALPYESRCATGWEVIETKDRYPEGPESLGVNLILEPASRLATVSFIPLRDSEAAQKRVISVLQPRSVQFR